MTNETVVAIYDNVAAVEAACAALTAAGISQHEISWTHPGASAPREQGFWSRLFGGEPDHDTSVYDRSLETGSQVLTVNAPTGSVEQVVAILEQHDPVDIEDHAAGLGQGGTSNDTLYGSGEAVLPLAEEQMAVGKRLVDRGTTRVRRFVVETPVAQDVSLHSERVSVERRPASGASTATPSFTDRVVEMTETDEEPVIGKTTRIAEEVVVRRTANDRVETVHDTLRREDVEVTRNDVAPTSRRKV